MTTPRLLFATALGLSLLTSPLALAEGDHTPLEEQMEILSDSLKGLRKAEDPESALALVHAAQQATLKSLEYQPKTFKKIQDPQELARVQADYKRLLGLTYTRLTELEMAILAGDEEKIEATKDALKDIKKEGHQAYEED